MNYYWVLPRDQSYRPSKPLTYSYEKLLSVGQIVRIPLKKNLVLGIVVKKTPKPSFVAKQIDEDFSILNPIPVNYLNLLKWIHSYYPGPMGSTVQLFVPSSLTQNLPEAVEPKPVSKTNLPALTREQQTILGVIKKSGPYLLHGDTGTGKTRIYIELALRVMQDGHSSLILTPEISLTSQLADDFRKVFGQRVLLIHSHLSEKARREIWVRILQTKEPVVLLGPRSALFAPFPSLGLVVVDEAHEGAYKQEQAPHYQAVRVASKLASLNGAVFILGSATPSVNDYYLAQQKNIPILRMRELAVDNSLDKISVSVVDLTDHNQTNRSPYLSNVLLGEIDKALAKNEQILLFLNRRGTARVVLCENCGWKALCPRCDLPLVYHGDSHDMQCHTCGFSEPAVSICPVCHQDRVVYKSIGTKAIAEAAQKLYPRANVRRFDTDNKTADRFENQYEDVKSGKINILVGTQSLVKGLDLPRLSVVGVIIAETSLYFPDFTASERTYQLLTQVMGRIGRGHRGGHAVIQTYSPDSLILKSAIKRDWEGFYKTESIERQTFEFPPYSYLLKLTCVRATSKSALSATSQFIKALKPYNLKIQILGPAPAFYEKIRNKYHWQVIVKSKDRKELLKVIEHLPSGWSYDIDPTNLL